MCACLLCPGWILDVTWSSRLSFRRQRLIFGGLGEVGTSLNTRLFLPQLSAMTVLWEPSQASSADGGFVSMAVVGRSHNVIFLNQC